MFFRSFMMVAALCGALGAAQFPAYSQQYIQRLGGAVDALAEVVADFDTSAASLGLTREEALRQMHGTAFVEKRRADMERTIARHERLANDLATLWGHGPFMRAYLATHLTDRDIAHGAWQAFKPALPLSVASILFAFAGFATTALVLAAVRAMFGIDRQRKPLPA